jgi:hypothetical protein
VLKNVAEWWTKRVSRPTSTTAVFAVSEDLLCLTVILQLELLN